MYRPLPHFRTIKESSIDGLGLFAIKEIPKDTNLGTSHVKQYSQWIRTPLGGFYNHSEKPNCIKKSFNNVFKDWMDLVAIADIATGEEITVNYTLYKVDKDKKQR